MIPQDRLSSEPRPSALLLPNPQPQLTRSRSLGGIALNDPSQGLSVRVWTAQTDGTTVTVSDGAVVTTLFSGVNVTEVSLAFDQNMRPTVAFVDSGLARLFWFDALAAAQVTTDIGAGIINPRLTLDDARESQRANSDIILAYVRNGSLFYRQQRDRFTIERLLATGVNGLRSVRMNTVLRLQFDTLGGDGGGLGPWKVGDVVGAIGSAAGIPGEATDYGPGMFNQDVLGFATSPDYSAAEAIKELAKVFFFDAQDADGKIGFIPRGGSFAAVIDESQFVDGEDEPETDTTRDSISVPRLLHLSYFDVLGGQGTDKQFSERQVSARSEAPTVLSTSVVLDATTAARALRIQHQAMEEELRGDLVFGVSDQRIDLAPADVIVVQYRGRSQRCRIRKIELLDGWQRITAVRDRQSAYTATVQAAPPAAVTLPPSTIVGATRFAFLDLPALAQSADVLGYYVATSGELPAWRGAVVEREEIGGAFALVATDGTGAVMGMLTAALALSSEHYSDESNAIVVQLARADDQLDAITRDQWLSRGNAAALVRADGTAEIVQFRSATETAPGAWRLTGLQRGRLNSGASAHAIGAVFVLLDGALIISAGSERISATLNHRAYSVGNDPSTAVTQARAWTARSQREWPPVITSAVRTGDSLAVAWVPRHRFGSEENPIASSHFDGWRIEATSGPTTVGIDALTPTATLNVAGLANPITVTVRGRNRLAGLGDAATRIVP